MLLFNADILNAILVMAVMFTTIAIPVSMWKKRRDTHRLQEMESLGRTLNMQVLPNDTLGLAKQLQEFDLFSRERSKWFKNTGITNVLRGQVDGTDVYLFDYTYVISTGKSAQRITQTVFFANDTKLSLPAFKMRPETWWHKVMAKTGWKTDINFPESPDFSEKFWLTSEFDQMLREQFTPAIQAFLTDRPPVHIEGNNYYLVAYKPGKTLGAEASKTFFEQCCALIALLKKEGKMELLDLAEWQKEKTVITPEILRKDGDESGRF